MKRLNRLQPNAQASGKQSRLCISWRGQVRANSTLHMARFDVTRGFGSFPFIQLSLCPIDWNVSRAMIISENIQNIPCRIQLHRTNLTGTHSTILKLQRREHSEKKLDICSNFVQTRKESRQENAHLASEHARPILWQKMKPECVRLYWGRKKNAVVKDTCLTQESGCIICRNLIDLENLRF